MLTSAAEPSATAARPSHSSRRRKRYEDSRPLTRPALILVVRKLRLAPWHPVVHAPGTVLAAEPLQADVEDLRLPARVRLGQERNLHVDLVLVRLVDLERGLVKHRGRVVDDRDVPRLPLLAREALSQLGMHVVVRLGELLPGDGREDELAGHDTGGGIELRLLLGLVDVRRLVQERRLLRVPGVAEERERGDRRTDR